MRAPDPVAIQTTREPIPPLRGPGPPWWRATLLVVVLFYLVMMWTRGVGIPIGEKILPQWAQYFTQVSRLFTHAAVNTIDYTLDGWDCEHRSFVQLDPAPLFPMHASNKESRFQRVSHFHRGDRPVMEALTDFIVARHNAAPPPGTPAWIGGIRVSAVRRPLPPVGAEVARYERPVLDAVPADWKKDHYWTRASVRTERCAARPPTSAPPAPP